MTVDELVETTVIPNCRPVVQMLLGKRSVIASQAISCDQWWETASLRFLPSMALPSVPRDRQGRPRLVPRSDRCRFLHRLNGTPPAVGLLRMTVPRKYECSANQRLHPTPRMQTFGRKDNQWETERIPKAGSTLHPRA
jgi:hypothetical protein